MRYGRWMYPLTALALMAAACGAPDRDAYAGTPEEGEPTESQPGMTTRADTAATGYSEWDNDSSGDLDQTEFTSWWNETSREIGWNTDQTEGLSEEEYYTGLVEAIDADGNGEIAQDEWQRSTEGISWEQEPLMWAELDSDGDLTVSTDEARQGLQERDLYSRVDESGDEIVDDEELGAWFRDLFDVDDNDRIDRSEWENNWFTDSM